MLVITGKKGECVVAGSRWCAVWRLVCLACLLAVVLPVFPEKHYAFTPIGASQGLSSNKVRNIAQLPDGRMMIMTEGQLNIYDGTNFSYLHYDQRHFCRLSEYSGFHHSYIDDSGYVWIKNQYTFMVVDIGREQFVERPDSLLAQWGIDTPVKDLFMDKEQTLWLINGRDELLRLGKDKREPSVFMRNVSGSDDQLYDLGVLEGKLYLFYRSGTLVCHDLVSGKELYRLEQPEGLPAGHYGNTSYVVQDEHSFYQLCNGYSGGIMLNYDVDKKNWEVVMSTDAWFNYLSIDRDKSIWVSGPEGLINISADLKKKQYIPTLKLVDGQKIDTEVSTFYNDRQGGMWIGTLNRGLFYYHPNRFRFQNIGKALFPLSDEEAVAVKGFAETAAGKIIVRSDDQDYLFAPSLGELSVCRERLPFADAKPDLKIQETDEAILQTVVAGRDTLAGITRHGWFISDRQSGKTDFYPSCHPCHAIADAGQGCFWIGLEDGLMLWEAVTGRQRIFYTSDGLVNNSVRSVIRTSDGAVWISTANGISRLTVQRTANDTLYTFVNFNSFDGVIANEFCERSVFEASDGTLYWGGIDGFNRLNPSSVVEEPTTYFPLFVGFSLFGERIESGKAYHGNVILERPMTVTRDIVLEHDQNFFTIEFSAMNYANPTQTYYRYQLEGIDKAEREIHSADGKGYATYTDLPSGDYVFKVRAAGNDKTWTEHYAQLHILVKTPFWRTGYAITIYVLLLAGSVCLLLMGYIKRKRRILVREQKERLDEMKTTFLQNINQELEEPIKKIAVPLDSLLKHTDEGRDKIQLQVIQQNVSELKSVVSQLSEGVLLPLPADESSLKLEELLVDMRRLLEQQEVRKEQLRTASEEQTNEQTLLTDVDEAFIRKALHFVELNLNNPEYSVEILSHDMRMDRTGLYRKLVAVVGKTPTNFIRSVRLKRAARLLEQGYTVAEVTDSVGFSTSSYFSKCFQEEFGVRPSQYVNSIRNK